VEEKYEEEKKNPVTNLGIEGMVNTERKGKERKERSNKDVYKQRRDVNCDSDAAGIRCSSLDTALHPGRLGRKATRGTARRKTMAADLPSDFSGPKPIQSKELQRRAWWSNTAGLVEFVGPDLP